MLFSTWQLYIIFVFQFISMCFLTLLALFIVAYAFLYLIALFIDCDLRLAWAEKIGKPIGKFEEKYIV
jgi:hypothetical protein